MHHGLGGPLPHQLTNAPRVHLLVTAEAAFQRQTMRFDDLYGISTCFQMLSPARRQVTHVLLTHPPLTALKSISASTEIIKLSSFDLHVLGTPPAFILSQDQTLKLRELKELIVFYCYKRIDFVIM